jgi:GNAT superfamily N-acetyltransferase
MTIKKISSISFHEVLDCFLLAFENYYVEMPTDRNYYKERWKATKINFNFSYGMFDQEKLIGFIIHAIDKRNGLLTAYNAGTGVIPEYRGKKIVQSIYEFALQDLKQNGIDKITLEVITKNEIAVRSYESIGFEICKKYNCFKGTIKIETCAPFDIKEVDPKDIDWESLPNQQYYSWDNQKESILAGNYHFFQVLNAKKPESFFIIKRDTHYLAQFDLLNEKNNGWDKLFSAIKQISSTIKINNVDEQLKYKIDFLSAIGLENSVDQYEMELKIKDSNTI